MPLEISGNRSERRDITIITELKRKEPEQKWIKR